MKKILLIMSAVAGATLASATPFTFNGAGLGTSGINVTYHDSVGTNTLNNIFAGQMKFSLGTTNLSTLCVSLRNTVGNGNTWDVTPSTLTSASGNLYIAGKIMSANIGSVSTAGQWTALQLAVWKGLYDGSNALGTNFIVNGGASSSILSQFSSYYAAGVAASSGNATYYAGGPNGYGQAQISAQAVPEPASYATLALGVVALVRRRRARRI